MSESQSQGHLNMLALDTGYLQELSDVEGNLRDTLILSSHDNLGVQSNKIIIFEDMFSDHIVEQGDQIAFESKFGADITFVGSLNRAAELGERFVHTLYTFRSLSRAIPMLISPDVTDREKDEMNNEKYKYNQAIIEIMHPEMEELKNLIEYIDKTIALFVETVIQIKDMRFRDQVVIESYYIHLLKLLDILILIDNIKDKKACLHTDFWRYKRCIGSIPGKFLKPSLIDNQNIIQKFLGNQDPRKSKHYNLVVLRDELKQTSGSYPILTILLEFVVDMFEKQKYVIPEEKFMLLRCIPYLLYLIDGNKEDSDAPSSSSGGNVFKNNKKFLAPLQRILKQFPVLPVYGDMYLSTSMALERCPHFERDSMAALWKEPEPEDGKPPEQYNLLSGWEEVRETYSDLTVQLLAAINKLSMKPFVKLVTADNSQFAERIFQLVRTCLQRLSAWRALITQTLVWKYSHPSSALSAFAPMMAAGSKQDPQPAQPLPSQAQAQSQSATGEQRPRAASISGLSDVTAASAVTDGDRGLEYERALKLNLPEGEMSILVDIISRIKCFSKLLLEHEATLMPVIQYHIHVTTQELCLHHLTPLLHRAHKRKGKEALLAELLQFRLIASDREDRESLTKDFIEYSRKHKKDDPSLSYPIRPRFVGPSHTQLQLLRAHVRALYDEKSIATKTSGLFSKPDLESEDLAVLEAYYSSSFFFPHMLNYAEVVLEAADLSDLWLREHFLDVTKCVQFPVDMSLPWLLLKHAIDRESKEVTLMEGVLHVLEIYNDTANRILDTLQQQHLFDELHAEANLVLDHFVFLISDAIYSHFKEFTASACLELLFKTKMEELKGKPFLSIGKHLFETVLSQQNFLFIGREINLNHLIGQHINNKFQRDIESAIQIFESADITCLPELKVYIQLIKLTHQKLSKWIEIDDFDILFHESNESFAPSAFCSRIAMHVLRSLITDIFPNYSYNIHTQRFVPSPVPLRPKSMPFRPPSVTSRHTIPSAAPKHAVFGHDLSRAYEATGRRTRGFFGRSHIEAYLSLCGPEDIPLLIEQTIEYLTLKVREMHAFYDAISEGIAPCKLPKFMYGTGGVYASFEILLKPIIEYEGLKADVFQCFREIGNVVMFLKDLSDTLSVWSAFQYFQSNALFTKDYRQDDWGHMSQSDDGDQTISTERNLISPFGEMMQTFLTEQAHILSERNLQLIVDTTGKVIESYKHRVRLQDDRRKSLLVFAMAHIQHTVHELGTSLSVTHSIEEALDVKDPKEFHRFLSALNFIFCMPDDMGYMDELDRTDLDEYGHGFVVAGCAILHLLGQRQRYELLDFSSHILNVHSSEVHANKRSEQVGKVDVNMQQAAEYFVRSAVYFQVLFREVMCLFEANYPITETTYSDQIFHAPQDNTAESDVVGMKFTTIKDTTTKDPTASKVSFSESALAPESVGTETGARDDVSYTDGMDTISNASASYNVDGESSFDDSSLRGLNIEFSVAERLQKRQSTASSSLYVTSETEDSVSGLSEMTLDPDKHVPIVRTPSLVEK